MKEKCQEHFHKVKAALCLTGFALFLGMVVGGLTGCGLSGKNQEWEKHIIREEIVLDGISREYDFLFLTDAHVVVLDETASEQEKVYAEERFSGFRNEEGVSASQQLHEWIVYANDEGVDAVFLGGDMVDSPSAANMEYLASELGSLKTPYLYTLGNHDWTYPWEYMTEAGRAAFLPEFERYMGGDTAIHMWETDEFRVIAVDNSSNQVNPAALEKYEELLKTEKAVILLMHVPFTTAPLLAQAQEIWGSPVSIGYGEGEIYPNDSTRQLTQLSLVEDSPVELILAGHVHFYDRGDIIGIKSVPQIVGDAAFHGSAVRLHVVGSGDHP